MIVYHAAWDLSALQLIATEVTRVPAWNAFARGIAASFLLLVGAGLVLAHPGPVAPRPFVRRLLRIAGAAALVTAGSAVAFPESFIFFGILHNIALSSLVALPFLRAPLLLTAAAALAVLVLPLAVVGGVFDAPTLTFLGLGTVPPVTNDFVPVFPWTGFVLAGIVGMRLLLRAPAAGRRLPLGQAGRWLGAVGRRSLLVYLLHQPLLFGALYLVAQLTGPNPAAEAAPFLRACEASCGAAGVPAESCARSCGCTVDGLRREGHWARLVRNRATGDDLEAANAVARACRAGGAG